MPSSITHGYIAKDVYDVLDKKIKNKFKENDLENYKTYSQGPDIFYFYNIVLPINKRSREIIEFGHFMHNNKVNEFFINLCKRVKESKNFQEFLFLMGLTTHYLADSKIHPFINHKASLYVKKNSTKKDNHFMLETYIDNYMIKIKEKDEYKKFKVHDFCFNSKYSTDIENLLNNSIEEIFDEKEMGISYYKALKDMKIFFKIFRYDPVGYKKYFFKVLNPIAKRCFRDVRYLSYNFNLDKDIEYLNLEHETWYNIDNKKLKSNKSFLELYDEVVTDSKNTILELFNYIYENKDVDLEKLFGNKSYSNGLKIK